MYAHKNISTLQIFYSSCVYTIVLATTGYLKETPGLLRLLYFDVFRNLNLGQYHIRRAIDSKYGI